MIMGLLNNTRMSVVSPVVCFVFLCFINYTSSQALEVHFTEEGGQCIPLPQCPYFTNLLKIKTLENLQKVRKASCGFNGRIPKVRCPLEKITQSTTTAPEPVEASLLPKNCGLSTTVDRIIGGENVPIGAYSWMAALGYVEIGLEEVEYMCGGTLINNNYILTAAHCVDPDGLLQTFHLTVINLGDWNLKTERDCEQLQSGPLCIPPAVKKRPADIVIHPDYNLRGPFSDDIALIRMESPVQFTAHIQPICLPSPQINVRSFVKDAPVIAAGWGLTEAGEPSDILQEVKVPFVDMQACNNTYKGKLNHNQVCFGGESQKDSCNGDSGGPIFLPSELGPPYTQIGIVSFGPPICGIQTFPAVYSSLPRYRDWIETNLRP